MKEIKVTVDSDMGLTLQNTDAGYEGEHNAAVFVIEQPEELDAYECFAEIKKGKTKSCHPVAGGRLPLTSVITERGWHSFQLVYSDNGEVIRKTGIAGFRILNSVSAAGVEAGEQPGTSNGTGGGANNAINGKDGKSAYEIWLDQGNSGTEQDFLDSLKGADGRDGEPGITAPMSGFFTMYVDAEGKLFSVTAGEDANPFELDAETGTLYYVTDREDENG